MEITDCRPVGTAHFLAELWRETGLRDFFQKAMRRRKLSTRFERALFGMVLNRAIDPRSKLGAFQWLQGKHVYFPAAESMELQDFYRVLDVLPGMKDRIERKLWSGLCNMYELDVDLVFYDTTSTYFETDVADGLRKRGYSRDHRLDLPQVVVGLAVNRDGLPLRHWVHPGNTADVATVLSAVDDLRNLSLERVVFVGDRAMGGNKNIAGLKERGIPYLIGAKLRDSKRIKEVLRRAGRYREVLDTLEVKEVRIGADRYVVCRNEEAAERDRNVRENILRDIRQDLSQPADARQALNHKSKKRYLVESGGGVRLDTAKIKEDARLDGKSVILVGDDSLSAEDAALGYRSRWRVESAFRHLKSFIDIHPVYVRLEQRIRAHVLLCVLSYGLERLAEIKTGRSWPALRDDLQGLHAVTWQDSSGPIVQLESLPRSVKEVYRAFGFAPPPPILSFPHFSPVAAETPDSR